MNLSRSSLLSSHRAAGRPERLLRSAITAFCSNARPTRREITQLDDLAVPLLSSVSDECLRFVSATLSDLPHAPPQLVRRLASLEPEISAPILMRSPVLTDVDLVALIGRHGLPHARAIAARSNLDARIAQLIESIGALEQSSPDKAEETRRRLRAMMRPVATADEVEEADENGSPAPLEAPADIYADLRAAAIAGEKGRFHESLSSALGMSREFAATISDAVDPARILAAFRVLNFSDEQCLLLLLCLRPLRFVRTADVSAILQAYASIDHATAERIVDDWRQDVRPLRAANTSSHSEALRAS